ncbi:LPXTG cell wall anchor domain-containing protein [Streptomyces radiopugnans]|nr:LPXTG cell wall anchor domain-containing protein [Streptomyces radiopugnans]
MANSRTRVRVARVAAGAVFLAGVSLTAVGTASALELTAAVQTNGTDEGGDNGGAAASISIGGASSGETAGLDEGQTTTGGPTTGDPTTGDPTTGGPTTGDPTTGGPTTGDPTTGGPTTGDPTTGGPTTGDPTTGGPTTGDPTTGGPTTGDPTTGGDTEGSTSNGGNSNGGSTGGSTGGDGEQPTSTGGTGGGNEDANTCILDESTVNCGPDTDSVGTRPISQEKPKEELAETGAAETTFLLIGAATMIAGGIGFRLMPRMVSRNTVA